MTAILRSLHWEQSTRPPSSPTLPPFDASISSRYLGERPHAPMQLDKLDTEMNNNVNGSSGMGHHSIMAQSNGYSDGGDSNGWNNISPYSHSPYNTSPMNEYSGFTLISQPHGLSSESMDRMPPPPQPQPSHQPHHALLQPAPSPSMSHHQLPMLNTAGTTWPSQLTNPGPSTGSYSAPPLSSTSVASMTSIDNTPRISPAQDKSARRTLSIEQKRAMCQYHEDHPGKRQADIGLKFGVERSTVSKVLRHKDQYLNKEQEPESSNVKRGKGKHPDFDRTLTNYVKKQISRGTTPTDDDIMAQAKRFASVSGNQGSQDGLLSSLTPTWLHRFKQKHGIGSNKLLRRASETNIPDSARMTTSTNRSDNAVLHKNDTPDQDLSPSSPSTRQSPLSGSKSHEDLQANGLNFDFSWRNPASQSNTSLSIDPRDSSFPGGHTISPTQQFQFSPDPNVGTFPIPVGTPDFLGREKRSNTFPSLNIDYSTHTATGTPAVIPVSSAIEPSTPRHSLSGASRNASGSLDSPAEEMPPPPFTIDTVLTSPPILHRSGSNSSLNLRTSTAGMVSGNPLDSAPSSPSQEDARRAANTLLSYIQSMSSVGQFDQSEYMTVVQLTKKLQLQQQHQQQQHQHNHPPRERPSIGGLSRIPEGDGELSTSAEMNMGST